MSLPQLLETYYVSNTGIEIYTPDKQAVQQLYHNNKNDAYWATVWPASIGLCEFLEQHPHLIRNKQILELAAGLGLPGLYAASMAQQITITDKEPLAELFVKQSALYNGLKNVATKTLNWRDAITEPIPEVVILSDVNYEPAVFEELKQVLLFYLHQKVTIIISTPQRLVAKNFITELLPYSKIQWNSTVLLNKKETGVSVFVLKNN